jgi:hypothetical protein
MVHIVTSPMRCGSCGTLFEAQAWHDLELVESIATDRVREFVTMWPDNVTIEVRQCVCGVFIARRGDALATSAKSGVRRAQEPAKAGPIPIRR